ncbi:MAG: protein kinase [Rhodanobacteraceae bacterium]
MNKDPASSPSPPQPESATPVADKARESVERDAPTVAGHVEQPHGAPGNQPPGAPKHAAVTQVSAQRPGAKPGGHQAHSKSAAATQVSSPMPARKSGGGDRLQHAATTHLSSPRDGANQAPGRGEPKHLAATQLSGQVPSGKPSSRSRAPTAPSAIGRSELPERGQVIKSRFELVEELGRGGMGAVFRARDLRKVEAQDPDQWVAIKFLSAALDGFDLAFVSLQREAKHAQTLNHPNVVKVFDFDRDDALVFLTMEVLEGESLQQRLHDFAARPLDKDERERIATGILAGVSYAHSHGITHADLKPSNVMVAKDGEPKVLDFGIARRLEHDNVFDADDIGALTVDYASPEMLSGERPTPSDDVYALGCIVFALHTGAHPFDHLRADQASELRRRPARPRSVSRVQWRALRKALSFKRAERHEDAAAFLRAYRGLDWRRIGAAAILAIAVLGTSAWLLSDPIQSYLARSNLQPQQAATLARDLHDGSEYLAAGYGGDSIPAFAEALSLDPYNHEARSGIRTAFDQAEKAMPANDYRQFLMSQVNEPSNPDWIRAVARERLDALPASR